MKKFNKAIKNQWVAALRSGDYKQGTYQLFSRRKSCFCVLGVLGDLNDLLDGDGFSLEPNSDDNGTLGRFLNQDTQQFLMIMNDDVNLNFNELADIIDFGITNSGNKNKNFKQVVDNVMYNHKIKNYEFAV